MKVSIDDLLYNLKKCLYTADFEEYMYLQEEDKENINVIHIYRC